MLLLPHDEEDVHMAVESELGTRLGAVAARLHTARSRNDQIALDLRLHVRDRGAELRASQTVPRAATRDGQPLMRTGEIPIRGRHNAENVLAASIAAARTGVTHGAIAAAVRTFRAVEHRLEFVRSLSGIDFYNDSKATSVDATLKALEAFPGNVWVILGGKDKGLDYAPLRAPLAAKARAALLIGAAAEKIAGQLDSAVPLVHAQTLDAAVAHAIANGAPGDTVLLAPACASFDQFQSFEHRGEVFKQLVNRLGPKE